MSMTGSNPSRENSSDACWARRSSVLLMARITGTPASRARLGDVFVAGDQTLAAVDDEHDQIRVFQRAMPARMTSS